MSVHKNDRQICQPAILAIGKIKGVKQIDYQRAICNGQTHEQNLAILFADLTL